MHRRRVIGVALVIAGGVTLSAGIRAIEKDAPPQDVTVQFAMPQPQPAGAGTPGTAANSSTHFLLPDDVTVARGGTVTFVSMAAAMVSPFIRSARTPRERASPVRCAKA